MNEPQVPDVPGAEPESTGPLPEVRSGSMSPARAARIARKINERGIIGRYRPAKGHPCILSERRQYRKLVTRQFPRLRSGRQWVKFRKALKRQGNLDYFSLPSYRTA